ncbi:relaxin receptor 2-like [Littorina saxatilis]|uniref:relaxin receptor 2-like n=1 Tax=Littorina saxatilis TaxID=31220 RepID=UPI0038B44FB3
MGVYLAIIGLADRLYQGSYLWEDTAWRHSVACKVAGFLSLLSCEVSALIVCFITLDRFLALRFPFSGFHFSSKASHVACAATWLLGVGVAAVPLLPATSHWQFYSQTGICIPLPVTRNDFVGRSYSFGVMIVLNFVLFMFMAVGQVFIYTSIQSSRMSLGPDSSRKEQDVNIARRLITIAVTDFLCWFPIGLLGLLASRGVAVPGEVNVAMAILVLPLNSALNPFLYSLNMLLERRRRAREQGLLLALEAQLLSESVH